MSLAVGRKANSGSNLFASRSAGSSSSTSIRRRRFRGFAFLPPSGDPVRRQGFDLAADPCPVIGPPLFRQGWIVEANLIHSLKCLEGFVESARTFEKLPQEMGAARSFQCIGNAFQRLEPFLKTLFTP